MLCLVHFHQGFSLSVSLCFGPHSDWVVVHLLAASNTFVRLPGICEELDSLVDYVDNLVLTQLGPLARFFNCILIFIVDGSRILLSSIPQPRIIILL